MQTPKIDYTQFNVNNLIRTPPVAKQSQPKIDPAHPNDPPRPIPYHEIPLSYKYTVQDPSAPKVPNPNPSYIQDPADPDNPEARIVDPATAMIPDPSKTLEVIADLFTELPELFSSAGLIEKSENGRVSYSLLSSFDLTKPDVRRLVARNDITESLPRGTIDPNIENGMIHNLFLACANMIYTHSGALGLTSKVVEERDARTIGGYPIFWSSDKTTGKVMANKNPSKYFNVFNYSGGRRTKFFTPLSGEDAVLPWELLKNAEMVFKPLVHWKKIYIGGGKWSIQFDIYSAVVSDIKPSNSESNQKDTIVSYQRDEALTQKLSDQINALREAMAASKLASKEDEKKKSEADTPSAGQQGSQGQMPSQNQQGASQYGMSQGQQGASQYGMPQQAQQGASQYGMPHGSQMPQGQQGGSQYGMPQGQQGASQYGMPHGSQQMPQTMQGGAQYGMPHGSQTPAPQVTSPHGSPQAMPQIPGQFGAGGHGSQTPQLPGGGYQQSNATALANLLAGAPTADYSNVRIGTLG